jgi:TPP-dependent pyruvate/acetoin dehydrogenase alpha subunit
VTRAAEISRDHAYELSRQMVRIRRFEERCVELVQRDQDPRLPPPLHPRGAVAVGPTQALEAGDAVVATYREHGHALVRGVSAGSIMAEMFGRVEVPS